MANTTERFNMPDLEQLVARFQRNMTSEALQYLESRAIKPEIVDEYALGFQPSRIGFHTDHDAIADYFENRIVFPIRDQDGKTVELVGRAIDSREPKYKSLCGNEEVFFNEPLLAEEEDVILCNSLFDCLVLGQEGVPAICLQANVPFRPVHAHKLAGKRVMICLGNDEIGLRESARIESMLRELQIEAFTVLLPENIRDLNDMFIRLQNPLDLFVLLLNQTIEQAMVEPVAPDARNLTVYQEEYLKRFRGQVSGVSTGFHALDQMLLGGFRAGLYLLSGSPAVGKTMLLKQIADFVAEQQVPAIYFSYDLTTFELWARSIARILGAAPSDILYGNMNPELVQEANQKYAALSQQLWTLEMQMDSTFQFAMKQAEKILLTLGRMPVIFIDNLERIPYQRTEEQMLSQAQFTAYIAYRLKELSREWHCPIVASVPLETKTTQLPLALEATADVIMELHVVDDSRYSNELYQSMSLDLRKNRNGMLAAIPLIFQRNKACFVQRDA